MQEKEWKIREQPEEAIAAISRALNVLPLTARLLYNRGYTEPETARIFVDKEYGKFYDPFLLHDMEQAVSRIRPALDRGERITVFGDYDVDGVTATTILYQYLAALGADVHYYIPCRLDEGYGLSTDAVKRLAEDGTKLIVTVDTGTTANEEADLIRSLGMGLVITDHHTCREPLPSADAVVNPKRADDGYPFRELAGVGVAFKLICALETADCRGNTAETVRRMMVMAKTYAEYTAIGTIADVMPLTDENRLIVDLGLALLRDTRRPGLLALMEHASGIPSETASKYPPKKKKITSSFIGYTIAPRINAAGRIARADRAVELFLTDSPELADCIARELCDANRERQDMENRIAEEAYAQIEAEHDLRKECILILAGENWHHGVIGIVASRVTEKYHIPAILISFDEEGIGKGSGRSIEGFNLIEGLTECVDLLERFGGHALAAGLSVTRENLEPFRAKLGALAKEAFGGVIPPAKVELDCETDFDDICLRSAEELLLLEPYGVANPTPLFCLKNAEIAAVTPLSMGKHTKLLLRSPEDESVTRTAMLFGVRTDSLDFAVGDLVDAAYQMDINDFQNVKTVQMIVQDIKPAESVRCSRAAERERYERCISGTAEAGEVMIPTREQCGTLYLLLRKVTENGKRTVTVSAETLCRGCGLPYLPVRLILDIFGEAGLLAANISAADISAADVSASDEIRITLLPPSGKKDLSETPTMKRLYCLYGGTENRGAP